MSNILEKEIENKPTEKNNEQSVKIINDTYSEELLHFCTFKTPIIYTFSLDFSEFYSL